MTDFIASAAKWISDYREKIASQQVRLKWPGNTVGILIQATVSGTLPESNADGVKLHTQYTHFVVKYATLTSSGVVIDRGLTIEWDGNLFELAYEKRAMWEWNDPHHIDIILKTIYKGPL
jgi:hypothetical protein